MGGGFLREVMKGWLISTGPNAEPGDTTPWFALFWEFCAAYCDARFGQDGHLSPEQSLLLYAENTVIPQQVILYTPKGTNNTIDLLFGTSLYDLRQKAMPPEADLVTRCGLRPARWCARRTVIGTVSCSGPCVAAGLISPSALAGYRNDAVYLRGSCLVPPRGEVVHDAMPALFDLHEQNASRLCRPWSGTGCSAIPIPTRTAMAAWRASS